MQTSFLSSIFDGIDLTGEGIAVMLVLLGAVVAVAALVNVVPRLLHKWELQYRTRDLTYGAVCLAMSVALSFARLFSMPLGGSVTPAALAPLFVYCYYFGLRKSMIVTAAYTLLQFLQGAYVISPWSAFFDYILPCFSICIVGVLCYRPDRYALFVRKNKAGAGVRYWLYTVGGHWRIFVGMAVHMLIRYLSSALSGILFFAEYAPPEYGPVAWGFLYNTVLLVDSAVAMAAVLLLTSSRSFGKYMTASFAGKKAVAPEAAPDGGDNAEPASKDTPADPENSGAEPGNDR